MSITDENVDDLVQGMESVGVPAGKLYGTYVYSDDLVLKVTTHGLVMNLWMAHGYQRAKGGHFEPAFARVEGCSPTGKWLLMERGIGTEWFMAGYKGLHEYNAAFWEAWPGLDEFISGRGSATPGTMLDGRVALLDAGLPPSNTYDIGLYDPAWMPAPF